MNKKFFKSIIIFSTMFVLTACTDNVEFSTPAQKQIESYTEQLKICIENAKKALKKQEPEKLEGQNVSEISLYKTQKDEEKKISVFNMRDDDIVLGDHNSKIVIIEYFAPTCHACAYYHKRIFPAIKEKYIDTKKVAYILREVVGNKQDLDAGLLVRCNRDNETAEKFWSVIMEQQGNWINNKKYQEIFSNIGQLGGLSSDQFSKCLNDKSLSAIIINNNREANKIPQFKATPAIFINGEFVAPPYSLEAVSNVIDTTIKGKQLIKQRRVLNIIR